MFPETMESVRDAFTVRVKVVVLPRGLPVTVIVKVPGVVEVTVVMVSVVVQVGLQEGCENVAVAPLGSPDAEKPTGCVEPASSVAVMVVAPDAPRATVTPPEFASE